MSEKGSGDFSIGSNVWTGASKLIEEMGELQQVLGKLIAIAGATEHWSGDLRKMLVDEIGDVVAATGFFTSQNFTRDELIQITRRGEEKLLLFRKWHHLHERCKACNGTRENCDKANIKCCPDCTHR